MRLRLPLTLAIVVLLSPALVRPCGFDPCYDSDFEPHSKLLRPTDWRWQRLPTLIGAYFGDAARTALLDGSREAGDSGVPAGSREEYETAAARLFASLKRPAPALPETRKTLVWDLVCQSNGYASAVPFVDAVAADPSAVTHAEQLLTWRARVIGLCPSNASDAESLVKELRTAIASDPALADTAGYIGAAALFYTGQSQEAAAWLTELRQSKNTWVREAATYTLARALMHAAQKKWDGDIDATDPIDQTLLKQSRDAFGAYVKAYPHGRYVDSARNMARRLALLAGDMDELNRLAFQHFSELLAKKDFNELGFSAANEIMDYVDPAVLDVREFPWGEPVLAATLIWRASGVIATPKDALSALEHAKKAYESYPGLYELVRIALLTAADQPEALTITAPAHAPEPVRFGVLYARGLALGKANQQAKGRAALHEVGTLLPQLIIDHQFTADVLQQHLVEKDYSDAFAPGSPFTNREMAQQLIERVADENTLRSLIKFGAAKDQVEAELMFRMLRDRRWNDFLTEYDKAGKPEPFTQVETAARTLARTADDPKALFNAGYFLHTQNGTAAYCCGCDLLEDPGFKPVNDIGVAPLQLYREAIDQFAKVPDASTEPTALHYAIFCFKQSSDAAACTRGLGDPVPEEMRKAWFTRLHSKYPSSRWAKETKYYY